MSTHPEFDFDAPPAPARAASAPPRAETLEKIKKLLRLGQSTNAAEAALAMQRAFELASRYGVDVESLDLDERTEKMAHEYFHCGERPSYLRQRVIVVVMTFFNVNACQCGERVVFVGKETDVQIAGYIYEYLVRVGGRCLQEFCVAEKTARRKVTGDKKKNFSTGFVYAITAKLGAAKEALALDDKRAALVVAQEAEREKYMGELVPSRSTKKLTDGGRRNMSALLSGHIAGKNTTISKPLGGPGGSPLMLG